jgi:hypothetical protein
MRDLAGRSMVTAGGWSLFLLFEGETGPLWWLAFLGLEMGVMGSLAVLIKLVTGRREIDGSGEDRRDRAARPPKGGVWAMLGFAALGVLLFFLSRLSSSKPEGSRTPWEVRGCSGDRWSLEDSLLEEVSSWGRDGFSSGQWRRAKTYGSR